MEMPIISTRGAAAEWHQLSRALHRAFAESGAISSDHPCADELRKCNYQRLCTEVRGHGNWVEGCYTRQTLLEGDGFVVLLLCWPPGISSPVHAHSDAKTKVQSNCFMLVLEGQLCETRYNTILGPNQVDASASESRLLEAGSYAYINDNYGVHKVGNASSTERAMSLHVYAPGWKTVQLYDEVEPSDASGAPLNLDGWGDF